MLVGIEFNDDFALASVTDDPFGMHPISDSLNVIATLNDLSAPNVNFRRDGAVLAHRKVTAPWTQKSTAAWAAGMTG